MKRSTYGFIIIAFIVIWMLGLTLGYEWGQSDAAETIAPLRHDRGRTPIVFDQFCDGWPDDPTPLRCARVVWCWTHRREEAVAWPLAEAIPFLKELEERSW